MDFAIPSQLLEVNNIHMNTFQKKANYPAMASLHYKTSTLALKHCTILTPPLTIDEWNPVKGRLRLNCDEFAGFKTKLTTIQDFLVNTIFVHQQLLMNKTNLTFDEINYAFKRLYERDILNCYISTHHLFPLYENSERVLMENFNTALQPGKKIYLILQLGGVSHLAANMNTFRIQHQILGAYIVN
jgi:hypothetical protein